MPGCFITFEGPEGAGKSTQVRLLAETTRAAGLPVIVTREPGGTAIGERIRAILLDRESTAMRPETEALLHTAARAQHIAELIKPALARGEIVLCDRFVDSTLAYQGGGRGLSLALLESVQQLATSGLLPDLRVLLDIESEAGLRRRHGEAHSTNRMDHEDLGFHQRVRAAYLALADNSSQQWLVIDADREIDVIAGEIRAGVARVLQQCGFGVQTFAGMTS